MTKKKLFLTFITLAAGSVLWAQQPTWTPKLTMAKEAWLPGEPISATLSLTNESGSAQPFAWHGQFYLDGAKNPCVDRFAVVASNPVPDTRNNGPQTPKSPILEPPGSIHQIEFAISRCCNLLAKASQTIGRHRLCYRDESVRGDGQEACIEFSILSPKGSDETVFKTFPPTLRDIICDASSLKIDLLASYPASTYAGYALNVPPPDACTFAHFDDAEVTLLRECDHGGGPNSPGTLERLAEAKTRYEDYARAAGLFLRAHPDFIYAPRIRARYAFCLAFTGKLNDAMDQVNILAQGQGKEADEAKAYLEAKGKK